MGGRGLLLVTFLTLAHAPASSLAGQAPSHPQEIAHPLISGEAVFAAGVILAAALVGDQGLRGEIQEHRGNTTNSVSDVGNALGDPRYLLPAFGAGYLVGQLTGDGELSRVALHTGGAGLAAGGIATVLKFVVGRTRPSGDGDADVFRPFSWENSFPSGHTALAFAVATALADETEDGWLDATLYAGATITALARLNDDRHWTSDVLAGALVGHLSARWLSRRSASLRVSQGSVGIALEF